MNRRVDYFNDPTAPRANSVVPSAAAFVLQDGKVLMTRRSDNGNWTMPSGAHDPGETLTDTVVRETREETGIVVEPYDIAGIYSDPRHVIHYLSNDEVRQEFSVVYRARYVSGEPTRSTETTEVAWVPADELDELPMDRSQRKRLRWALTHDRTWIDPTGLTTETWIDPNCD